MSRHSSQYSKIFCFDVSGLQVITFNSLEGLLIFYVVQLSGYNSLLANTLVYVKLCQELQTEHPYSGS